MSSSSLGGAVARTVASSERCSCTVRPAKRGWGLGGGVGWGPQWEVYPVEHHLHDEHEPGEGARGQLRERRLGQRQHSHEE